jgi:hypothetical protein
MPKYTVVLMRGRGSAQQLQRVSYDSGDRELKVGDVIELHGQQWRLTGRQVFPAENEPEGPGFAAEPIL